MGTRDQIYKATELITELVHKSCNGGGGGGGQGGGGGGGNMGSGQNEVSFHRTFRFDCILHIGVLHACSCKQDWFGHW